MVFSAGARRKAGHSALRVSLAGSTLAMVWHGAGRADRELLWHRARASVCAVRAGQAARDLGTFLAGSAVIYESNGTTRRLLYGVFF